MNRILTVAATSFVLLTGAAGIASAQPNTLIAQDTGKPLTITAAKNQVTSWLSATGHSVLHVGQAEFDRQGNVKVEIDNPTGTPYTHVLVHAVDGMITDARSGVAGNKG
jgi:maltose-binding protein MalE